VSRQPSIKIPVLPPSIFSLGEVFDAAN
jgi:hypothetical protein